MENILRRFGYVKDDGLLKEIGSPVEYSISKQQDEEFFRDLANVEGVREYLKATVAKDIMRYFAAKDEKEQAIVRGAYARTMYLLSKIKKV